MQIESLILCHKNPKTIWSLGFYFAEAGIRKGGTSGHTGVKIESWRAIFSPWENPLISGRSPCGCGQKLIMFANTTQWVVFLIGLGWGFEPIAVQLSGGQLL